jgi:hypothetical protein
MHIDKRVNEEYSQKAIQLLPPNPDNKALTLKYSTYLK